MMQRTRSPQWSAALVLSTLAAASTPAANAAETAKDNPNRPIRMIMPQGIGASNDTLARVLNIKLDEVRGSSW